MKKSLLLLIVLFAVFTACSKDDNNEPKEKTRTELLTQAPWKFINSGMSECALDDTWTFFVNGTMKQSNGSVKCNSGEPSEHSGTWGFKESEKQLFVEVVLVEKESGNEVDTFNLTILTLNETTLKVKMEDTELVLVR